MHPPIGHRYLTQGFDLFLIWPSWSDLFFLPAGGAFSDGATFGEAGPSSKPDDAADEERLSFISDETKSKKGEQIIPNNSGNLKLKLMML